jgi:hypothetical protein
MVGIIFGVQIIIGIVALMIAGSQISERSTIQILLSQLVSNAISIPISMLMSIAAVVAYAELRSKQQFTNSPQLATEAALGH